MTRLRAWLKSLIYLCLFSTLSIAQDIPRWKVDPSWPKPLPNNWMLGHPVWIMVDKDDNIWVAHYGGPMDRRIDHVQMGLAQTPPIAECCVPAPEVIQYDPEGNVLKAWGGPGYVPQWPEAIHAFWIDKNMNVWIGGNHAPDRNVLKFTADGKLLLEIGRIDTPIGEYRSIRPEHGIPNNQATDLLGAPGAITVDEEANEVYVGDGYINKRIVVFDSNTGKFKRGWGAYGIPLSEIDNNKLKQNLFLPGGAREAYDPDAPPDKQFTGPVGSIRISKDGLVYVIDGGSAVGSRRIQVFSKEGRFVKEFLLKVGDPHGFTFSRDPGQKYLIMSDSTNQHIRVLNRKDASEVTWFGSRGKNAGQFGFHVNRVDIDSKGNLYVGEARYGNRNQKFVPVKEK